MKKPHRADTERTTRAPSPADEPLALPEEVRTRKKGLRPVVRTVAEAVRLIDRELPPDLQKLPRWTFARALLVEAERTGKKRDLASAARQLKQALGNEGWLDTDSTPAGQGSAT